VPARKPLSKRLRFAIFARDQFTCRYCGKQSDETPLHIDHIVPVSKGGTNDEQNLVTACADCNLGKADKSPTFAQPTEADRLRAAQEYHEQRAAAERAKSVIDTMREFEQDLVNLWCEAFDEDGVEKRVLKNLVAIAREHGVEQLASWMAITAAARISYSSDTKRIRYIYGIRRNFLKREGEANRVA
jgi:CRISPR/Cas system Type II protein with McrA/HNH and RuvC-like nuclease domain